MPLSPQAEAIVQVARKRRVLDPAQCARLAILLERAGVADAAAGRAFLAGSGLLPPPVARHLLQHVPAEDQVAFGAYLPLMHLADGGMGSAWLAADPDGRLVVVKTAKTMLAENLEVRSRFEREARIMQDLAHPNVVACLGSGAADDGTLFMALEFVAGGDLKDLIEAEGSLAEPLALAIVYQIADALVAAERRSLVHRDIKPANIFAGADGHAKLADFGIARSTESERTQLTADGVVVGSPYYMSPEQIRSDPEIGTASDIYALGVVLYTALAGTEPYHGSLHAVLQAHCQAPIPEIRDLRPQVSTGASGVIRRCLQKEAADRFASAEELREAVGAALADLERHENLETQMFRRRARSTGPANSPSATVATATLTADNAATMTADLLAEAGSEAATQATVLADLGTDPDATVAADLRRADPDATMAADLSGDADATMAADLRGDVPTARDRLDGDFARALQQPWIVLEDGQRRVVLVAKRRLLLGKLCEPPVDICLRRYPTDRHREACLRISRQHLRLDYDDHDGVQLIDLGSGNGTVCDGTRMEANQPVRLEARHELDVAAALALRLDVIARSGTETWKLDGAPPSTGGRGCGIECSHQVDAVAILRSDNAPERAYAMVLRRISVGGAGSDLPLPGLTGRVEIGLYGGRWIWRELGAGLWRCLCSGDLVRHGDVALRARAGEHDVYA